MKTNINSLLTITMVFFFWGFVAASNDILIPVFKEHLNLEQWQSQLISVAFYISYTVGALLYMFISVLLKKDILNKIGYKNGIALGLIISALGTLLFIPAANNASFYTMISGLFIVGLGFSLQQTAANPLTINMGDPATGSQRLSLAGGINNLGTTIGPLLLSYVIFGAVSSGEVKADISSIKIPYLCLGIAFILVAVILKFSKIPNRIESTENESENSTKVSVFKYPQLTLGMLAIFVYVGVEVATAGNISELLKSKENIPTDQVAPFVSLFWASLMIGRWTSAAGAFSLSKNLTMVFRFILPYVAFGIFLLINYISNNDISMFYNYAFIIAILITADYLSFGNPSRQLLIFSLLGITSLSIGMSTSGMVSIYAFIAVGLFCSTLWPCIFTLAITGLGNNTSKGSGYLIMMIMGGGIVSLIQGILAGDNYLGIKYSFIVGIVCFAYLAFYAIKTQAIFNKSGLKVENSSSAH